MNVARLLAALNLETEPVPDVMKCVECKRVLKDACQLPCGCRFCRLCIDAVAARGAQFCPGGSWECGETPLSSAVPDYGTNKSISRLTARCPHAGCAHACPLADMEAHLRACPRQSVDCPFRGFGCLQGGLAAEEMGGHLQRESGSHSEILIGLVADITREMGVLQRELAWRDEQMRTVMDEMSHVQNENKAIKVRCNLIGWERCNPLQREKEALSEQVRQLSEKLEREIDRRVESDERDSARDAMATELESVKNDVHAINRHIQSMKGDIDSLNAQVQAGLECAHISCTEWPIAENLDKTNWYLARTGDKFRGAARPYTYQLASWNHVTNDELYVGLRILADPGNCQLEWPFWGEVTISVAHMDRRALCQTQTLECLIGRPVDRAYSWGEPFVFRHSELRAAGLDLALGVRVSCRIVARANP